MRYDLTYLPSFIEDMRLILGYLSEYTEQAAKKFEDEVERDVESLSEFPKRFARYEKIPVFRRMLVLYDYQVFYTVNDDTRQVQVHHILHGHRDIQNFLRYEKMLSKNLES